MNMTEWAEKEVEIACEREQAGRDPSEWDCCVFKGENVETYQCRRMSSLFKHVYKDGSVKYTDVDRVLCFYNYNDDIPWHNGMVREIIDEMFPITMPYYPSDPYKVYCTEFLTDEANGDYDTIGILYVKKGDRNERHDINRYFKEGPDGKMVEITTREYMERRRKAKALEEQKNESY